VTVRALRPGDEPAVRALQDHLEYADPDLVAAAVEGPFLGLVAVEEGAEAVVGYAVALPGRRATLSELVVAPDHRRAGHGRALVEAVASEATDVLVVTTPADERGPRRFYEELGFVIEERLSGFYGDGPASDALRLVRRE
jgi:ribosomal-protein-alanine N-acetyltransferase